MTRAAGWFSLFVDAVLPPRCIACAQPVGVDAAPSPTTPTTPPPPTTPPTPTSPPTPPTPTSRTWCTLCAEQLERVPASGSYAYAGPLADAIRRAKVGRDAAVARALASWWANAATASLPAHDAITFVPAPWLRRVMRGFDLPALLATALGDEDGARPVVELLAAARHDRKLALARSREERQALVQGRFARRRTRAYDEFAGRVVLVVDDVHTTGATLGAACAVLAEGGVRPVPWALAVTPAQG